MHILILTIQLLGKINLPKVMLLDPGHEYIKPKKTVHNESMMKEWENTEAYHVSSRHNSSSMNFNSYQIKYKCFQEYFGFIKAMNIAIRGKPLSQECHVSPITEGILNLLNSLNDILTETPPIDQPQRFGNRAFKIWYERLQKVNPKEKSHEFSN